MNLSNLFGYGLATLGTLFFVLSPNLIEANQSEGKIQNAEFRVQLAGAKRCCKQIASLSQVKAPYGGTVRRIKWLGQSPDGSLTAEITLMIAREK